MPSSVPIVSESAFLSATVESARFLQDVQARLLAMVQLQREQRGGPGAPRTAPGDRRGLLAALRQVAQESGLQPGDGTRRDTSVEPKITYVPPHLEASAAGLTADFKDKIKEFFGDRVTIEGDRIRWAGPRTVTEAAKGGVSQ